MRYHSGSDDARVAWCRFGVRDWVGDPAQAARVPRGTLHAALVGAVTSVRVVVEIRAGRPIARGTTGRVAPVSKAWAPTSGVSFGRVL